MAIDEKIIYVYDDFSEDSPCLIGKLYVGVIKGGETYSFEYDADWLAKNKMRVSLDPQLQPFTGRQFPTGKNIFGMFSDASPDRWGRVLMNKRERILAGREQRKPRKLHDSDYLLGVYDETRMGGIRFKLDPDGLFLSDDKETATPPWIKLRTLEEASRNFENDEKGITDEWLNQLIKPESKLEKFSKLGSTFLVRRFDRDGNRRIHFASAMTLLGKTDGASAEDGTSYLDIVSFIKAFGSNPKADLMELWKRIVFNMAVTNTDDHLRNHAFLFADNGWKLSPLYDVNPVPYGDELSLLVDDRDNNISIELAINTANRFGIQREVAENEAEEILTIVRNNWEKKAKEYDLSRGQIEYMRPAFDACYNK